MIIALQPYTKRKTMAKSKIDLNALLEDIQDEPPSPSVPTRGARARRAVAEDVSEPTVLVGANLHPRYARNLAFLHAETGRSKKELMQEALDLLFRAKGGPNLEL
jgi:hypothetical protein